jgi:hypothetical protein
MSEQEQRAAKGRSAARAPRELFRAVPDHAGTLTR